MQDSLSKTPISGRPLRVALVFPPAMAPTSPPLGIAALKAYLSENSSAVVRNFDLNLDYHEKALDWVRDGLLKVSLRKMDQSAVARQAPAARDFFRGGQGPDNFFDLNSYNAYAEIYTSFGSVLNGLFDSFSRKILIESPVPALAHKFFDGLIEPLASFRPDLVGFSILFSQQLFFALALSKLCKKIGAKTVLGGATFSVMPDPGLLLSRPVGFLVGGELRNLDLSSLIDFLVVGEGEFGLKSLVDGLSGGGQLSRGPGLIQPGMTGEARVAPKAPSDLDHLPLPDYSDFPLDLYHSPHPVLPYLSARGCPWRRCAFCTHQKTYLEYREESAEISAERIVALRKRYGISHLSLVDEMIHPRRLDHLCRGLSGEGISFSAYARPAGGFEGELFKRAHASGLRVLMWGVESGSRRVLDLMCKGTDIARVGEILEGSHNAGIWNLIFTIFGFPTETDAEWESTLDFIETNRTRIDALSKSRFVLLEGSNILRDPLSYGIRSVKDRREKDPVSVAYDYETVEGLTPAQVALKFRETLPRLSGIGKSPFFGQFRDHMLIFASAHPK